MRGANLTTNAKASGRKLTLLIIKDLEKDREPWMADVVRKSELLGQHDTINTKWIPQNQDYQVKITGVVSAKSQPDPSKGSASSDTSTAGDVGVDSTTSTAGGGKVKREKRATPRRVLGLVLCCSLRRQVQLTCRILRRKWAT